MRNTTFNAVKRCFLFGSFEMFRTCSTSTASDIARPGPPFRDPVRGRIQAHREHPFQEHSVGAQASISGPNPVPISGRLIRATLCTSASPPSS